MGKGEDRRQIYSRKREQVVCDPPEVIASYFGTGREPISNVPSSTICKRGTTIMAQSDRASRALPLMF